jgi:4-hydroxythreonine-4-phosphate dehydrogenase
MPIGRVALAMGCPAGIAPELTARVLADEAILRSAAITVFGDRRVLDAGAKAAGVSPRIMVVSPGDETAPAPGHAAFVDLGHLDPATIPLGVTSEGAGRFAIENFRSAIAYGSVVASFTCEAFSANRLAHLTRQEIDTRLNLLRNLTHWPA